MEINNKTKEFLNELAKLCDSFDVTRIKSAEQDRVLFVIDNSEVAFGYCKPFEDEGTFYAITEKNYESEYYPSDN